MLDKFNFKSNINSLTKGAIYTATKINDTLYRITISTGNENWDYSKKKLERNLRSGDFIITEEMKV